MTELFLENGHLTDEGLQALLDGSLDEMQRLEAAEHLSFCDECLVRYTDMITPQQELEPPQDQTLSVMRRLRKRAAALTFNRYSAAVAAVVVTGALWYSGVFGGVAQAIASTPTAPVVQSEQSDFSQFYKAWDELNQKIFNHPSFSTNRQTSPQSTDNPA